MVDARGEEKRINGGGGKCRGLAPDMRWCLRRNISGSTFWKIPFLVNIHRGEEKE
jgi:hypothetical protein